MERRLQREWGRLVPGRAGRLRSDAALDRGGLDQGREMTRNAKKRHGSASVLLRATLGALALCIVAPTGADAAIPVSSCGTLSTSGETYELTQDLSASGSCIRIDADDVTLDLKGHTVTFDTANAGNTVGIEINASGVTVTSSVGLGNVVQDAGCTGSLCGGDDAVLATGGVLAGGHLVIENLEVTVQGYDTYGIYVRHAGSVCHRDTTSYTVRNNTIHHFGTSISDRENYPSTSIKLYRPAGPYFLLGNTIDQSPHAGIQITGPGHVAELRGCEDGSEIANNSIDIDGGRYTNSSALNIYKLGGVSIHDNTITGDSLEGIQLDNGFWQGTDLGDGGESWTLVYNNTLGVTNDTDGQVGPEDDCVERIDYDYTDGTLAGNKSGDDGPGKLQGIRIRYGPQYMKVYNNWVCVNADDAAGSEQNIAEAIKLCVTCNGNEGKEIYVYDNLADAFTDGVSTAKASALTLDGVKNPENANVEVRGNILRSNHRTFTSENWGIQSGQTWFRGNTFEKTSPSYSFTTFRSLWSDNTSWVDDYTWLDPVFSGGTDKDDIVWTPSGNKNKKYSVSWTLDARCIDDVSTAPVEGCVMELFDNTGALVSSCTTDSTGGCDLVGTEFTEHQETGRVDFNPHNLRATRESSSDESPVTLATSGQSQSLSVTAGQANLPPSDVQNLSRTDVR